MEIYWRILQFIKILSKDSFQKTLSIYQLTNFFIK